MDTNIIKGKSDLSNVSDVYSGTLNITYDSYVDGGVYMCKMSATNTTTTPTLNLNSIGAKTIVDNTGSAIKAGDLLINGYYNFMYNLSSDKFYVVSGNGFKSNYGPFGIANASGVYTYYSTITLVGAAWTSGQTIEMFADVTESGAVTFQPQDGMKIDGHGHTYTHSGSATAFDDANTAPTVYVSNFNLVKSGTGNGWDTRGRTIGCNFNITISTTGYYAYYGDTGANGVGITIYTTAASSSGVVYNTGTISDFNITVLNSSATSAVNNTSAGVINNSDINCTGTYAVTNSGVVNDSVIRGAQQSCSGGIFNNCYAEGTSRCFSDCTENNNCTAFSATSGARCYVTCASVRECVGELTSSTSGVADNCTSIIGGTFILNAGNASVIQRNTTITGAKIYNLNNGTSSHGVQPVTNGMVNKCYIFVTNASANALYNSGAINLRYSGNDYKGCTTPVNANITPLITNTTDSQGNLLIN